MVEGTQGTTKRSIGEGIGYGLIAGAIFAVVWMLGSVAMGQPALTPFRLSAGVFFGAGALEFGTWGAFLGGALVGLVVSAIFGAIYGLINARLPLESHVNMGTQTVLGLVFGAAVWVLMFQIIARAAWPWLLEPNQLGMFILHAVFFGLPLGLMFAAAERRAMPHGAVPQPT